MPRSGSRGRYVRNPGRPVDKARRLVAERRATTAALTRAGFTANEIAVRLGVDQRTVLRYRQEIRNRQAQQQFQLAS